MKRKLISFCTAVIMASTFISPVSAAGTTAKDLAQGIENHVNVDADIELHKNATGTFADGAITVVVPADNPTAKFDYRATLYMKAVRDKFKEYWNAASAVASGKPLLEAALNATPVSGEFTVKVTYPATMTIPEYIKTSGSMIGFNDEAKKVFTDTSREVDGNVLTIKIKVKDPADDSKDYILGKELNDNLDKYLANLTLTCEGVEVTGVGTHTIKGEVEGYTVIGETVDPIDTVTYTAVQIQEGNDIGKTEITEDVILVTPTPSPEPTVAPTAAPIVIPPSGGGGGRSGGGGGGSLIAGGDTPTDSPVPIATIDPNGGSGTGIGDKVELDRDNHYAYIIGYPEGDVRPTGNITRAEVTTIFFRMLTDASRAEYWTKTNNYPDVWSDEWFNNAISTVTVAGIVNGYDDGTFKPNNAITRGELAAIIARFIGGVYSGGDRFNDISGHWAAEAINRAAYYGWINGYEDATYRPDQKITRAEAMTLINNVLNRHVGEDKMLDDMVKWPDNKRGTWYYTAVQEATNSHYYDRAEGASEETWTSIREPRDWAALETELSNANSAGEEKSVYEDAQNEAE